MPIRVHGNLRRPTQEEFNRTAYAVIGEAFRIHGQLGRFFDEKIYQWELMARVPEAQAEVPIEISFGDFKAACYLDLLVAGGSPFELKAVEVVHGRHRGQLLNYLLLTELPRGKLINFRPESVAHEFVNTTLCHPDRKIFEVADTTWVDHRNVLGLMTEILRDWGTCLDVNLYTDALTHFLGGEEQAIRDVEIVVDQHPLGAQKMHLVEPGVAFKISALPRSKQSAFGEHLRRFLNHTELAAIQWINITRERVSFQTIGK